jgi:hypothetical protein
VFSAFVQRIKSKRELKKTVDAVEIAGSCRRKRRKILCQYRNETRKKVTNKARKWREKRCPDKGKDKKANKEVLEVV